MIKPKYPIKALSIRFSLEFSEKTLIVSFLPYIAMQEPALTALRGGERGNPMPIKKNTLRPGFIYPWNFFR